MHNHATFALIVQSRDGFANCGGLSRCAHAVSALLEVEVDMPDYETLVFLQPGSSQNTPQSSEINFQVTQLTIASALKTWSVACIFTKSSRLDPMDSQGIRVASHVVAHPHPRCVDLKTWRSTTDEGTVCISTGRLNDDRD